MKFQTPYRRAMGLGAAHEGTRHFILQRISAIALVPLTLLFLWKFIPALGAGREAVIATYAHPFHALVAIALIYAAFEHLMLGVQVVIEDYVSGHMARLRLLILNGLFWRGMMIVGIFAVAKIAIGAA